MFFILSLLNIILLIIFKVFDYSKSKNILSPVALFIYFALIPAFSNLYFSLNIDSFEKIVLSQIDLKFHDYNLLYYSLILTIFSNVVIYVAINLGSNSKKNILYVFFDKIFFKKYLFLDNKYLVTKNFFYSSLFIFLSGLFVYFIFLIKMGGLVQIWEELNMRSKNNSGLGYYQTYYTIAINFSSLLLYFYYKKKGKNFFKFMIVILTIFISGSIGARGPIIIYLFSLFILNHYVFRRKSSLISIKFILIFPILAFLILALLQLREKPLSFFLLNKGALVENVFEDIESGLIARVGRLERDLVILGYFKNNQFWYGKSYLGLIYAPIPRSNFPEKPPVDSGMYLRTLALGKKVNPPISVDKLDGSSWPEHNWAGYMNFGLLGLFSLNFLSGYFYGVVYSYVKNTNFNILVTSYMSLIFIGGIPILSPPGLVKQITYLLFISIILLFFFMPKKLKFI